LAVEQVFPDPVEVVDHRHPAPADAEGGMHIGLGPVEDARQLVPIGDVLEIQMLDRRAGDDQPVEFLARLLHLREGAVERLHMCGGGVLRLVARHPDQRQFDLQGRRADQAGELRLGLDLLGHQVQEPDAQGADVLPVRRTPAHDHDALVAQDGEGGQGGGQADGHGIGSARSVRGALPRRRAVSAKGGGHHGDDIGGVAHAFDLGGGDADAPVPRHGGIKRRAMGQRAGIGEAHEGVGVHRVGREAGVIEIALPQRCRKSGW
jgi:hypothetical protein